MKNIDIIVPVYNEEQNVSLLFESITSLELPSYFFNFIFVNDGSSDHSKEEILKLKNLHSEQITLINFSRNFGHQAALKAGLKHSRAQAAITMDADLQHPPSFIPKLLEKWEEGNQIVYTVREENNQELSFFKKFSSDLYYKLINKLTNIEIPKGSADFRLWDQQVVEEFRKINEKGLFLRGLSPWMGYKQAELSYKCEKRQHGETKYNLKKMLILAIDGITSFSSFPLYISSFVGFFIFLVGLIWGCRVLYIKLFTTEFIQGWASIMTLIILVGGIQIFLLGIIGIYLAKIHQQIKDRPDYIIESIK